MGWPAYFPDHAGHNDIVEIDMQMYFQKVANFLQDVKRKANGYEVYPPKAKMPKQVEMAQTVSSTPAKDGHRELRLKAKLGGGREAGGGLDVSSGHFISSVPKVKAGP